MGARPLYRTSPALSSHHRRTVVKTSIPTTNTKKNNTKTTRTREAQKISPHVLRSLANLPKGVVRDMLSTPPGHGGVKQIMPGAHATPRGVKLNCYAHFLGMRYGNSPDGKFITGTMTNRVSKAQPGERCKEPGTFDFHNRVRARKQLIERVLCDNPDHVFLVKPPYTDAHLKLALPDGYHMGIGIVGPSDYHFLRRELIDVIMKDNIFKYRLTPAQHAKLRALKSDGVDFVWSQVHGWSGPVKITDASGNIVINPVPDTAVSNIHSTFSQQGRANHAYNNGQLTYDTVAGLYIIRSRRASVSPTTSLPVKVNEIRQALANEGIPHKYIQALKL